MSVTSLYLLAAILAAIFFCYPATEISGEKTAAEENRPKSRRGLHAIVSRRKYYHDHGPVMLDKSNFDAVVRENDYVLVLFYTSWCTKCQSFFPVFSNAAKTLKHADPPVILAAVPEADSGDGRELSDRFRVTGYPTMKFFKKGEVTDYTGPRDEEGLVNYVMREIELAWLEEFL